MPQVTQNKMNAWLHYKQCSGSSQTPVHDPWRRTNVQRWCCAPLESEVPSSALIPPRGSKQWSRFHSSRHGPWDGPPRGVPRTRRRHVTAASQPGATKVATPSCGRTTKMLSLFGRKSSSAVEVASPLDAARTGLASSRMPPHDVLDKQFRAFLVRAGVCASASVSVRVGVRGCWCVFLCVAVCVRGRACMRICACERDGVVRSKPYGGHVARGRTRAGREQPARGGAPQNPRGAG